MMTVDRQARYAANLVGGLADAGVDMVFISPGSRNTPLTIAFANEPRIRDVSIRDERSGGFAALGYAKVTGTPAVVVCTSGSAATHYLPAIVEADQSATPLIVLTADRPVRLRGTGAPQTMNQVRIYGDHVKTFIDLDTSDPDRARDDAIGLAQMSLGLPAGPVHGNLPFDEPLVPDTDPPVPPATPIEPDGIASSPPADIAALVAGKRTLIVAGGRGGAALARAVSAVAERIAAPVFADPQTNIAGGNVLTHGDILVTARSDTGARIALDGHRPDLVLRLGPIPTSKAMWSWLEESGVDQVLVDESRLTDPLGSATTTITGDPVRVLLGSGFAENADHTFLDAWRTMDRVAAAAVEASTDALPFPSEPAIARAVAGSVPGHSILFVGSSRPIRDLDAYAPPRPTVTVIANRGVNGIDGTISTALGAAITGTPTTLYLGDVTALHDISALSEVARLAAPLRIFVVNNDGGGIFSFLPQARSGTIDQSVYERHWGTPHGLSIAPIAQAMGLPSRTVTTRGELVAALSAPIETPELVEIDSDRLSNVAYHRAVVKAVARALAGSQQVEQRP